MALNLRTWPRVRFQPSINRWIVDARRVVGKEHIGNKEYFLREEAAKGRAGEIRSEVARDGEKAVILPNHVKADAIRAEELLKPYGKTVLDAARFMVESLKTRKDIPSVEKAVSQWLQTKQLEFDSKKIKPKTLECAKFRIGLFNKHFKSMPIADVSFPLFEEWMLSIPYANRSKANIKAVISEFFKWCKNPGRGWVKDNPCDYLEFARGPVSIGIFTPEEARELLDACKASPIRNQALPFFALCTFAGLRPWAEAGILDKSQINLKTGFIKVESTKTRPHIVKMEPGLAEFLTPFCKGQSGPLVGPQFMDEWQAFRKSIGYGMDGKWTQDIMRHTYASYWLPIHNDKPRLAEYMGNSEAVIKRDYYEPREESIAKEFWKILLEEAPPKSA